MTKEKSKNMERYNQVTVFVLIVVDVQHVEKDIGRDHCCLLIRCHTILRIRTDLLGLIGVEQPIKKVN